MICFKMGIGNLNQPKMTDVNINANNANNNANNANKTNPANVPSKPLLFIGGVIDESFYRAYLEPHAFLAFLTDMNCELVNTGGDEMVFPVMYTVGEKGTLWIIKHRRGDKYMPVQTPNNAKMVAAFMEFNEFETTETNISGVKLLRMIYSKYYHCFSCVDLSSKDEDDEYGEYNDDSGDEDEDGKDSEEEYPAADYDEFFGQVWKEWADRKTKEVVAVITNVEMAKNLVEMTYDAPLVYEDEIGDDAYEQFEKLFGRDSHMYFTDAEREAIRGQLYNVFWAILLIRAYEKNQNNDDTQHKYHRAYNAIYGEIKWESECVEGRCGKFEHVNQVYLLREGLKIYLRK